MNLRGVGVAWCCVVFGLFGCSAERPSPITLERVSLSLPRPLKAEGLRAEVLYYEVKGAESTPRKVDALETLSLTEGVYETLSVNVSRELPVGSYLMRVYLVHEQAQKLLWVGEWEAGIIGGETIPLGLASRFVYSGSAEQLHGDAHPLVTRSEEPFGPTGQENVFAVCVDEEPSCDGALLRSCDSEGFGYVTVDCAAIFELPANSLGVCSSFGCSYECDQAHHGDGAGACISDLRVDSCGPEGVDCTLNSPQNGSSTCDGTICGVQCDLDYFTEEDTCINSREVTCNVENAPSHSTPDVVEVIVDYTTEEGWGEVPPCNWDCESGYHVVGELGACLGNTTVTSCGPTGTDCTIETLPENTDPLCDGVNCGYECKSNYDKVDGECINSQEAPCTDMAPDNATSNEITVTLNYTDAGGWDLAPEFDCGWSCNGGYHRVDDQCVVNTTFSSCGPAGLDCNATVAIERSAIICDGSSCTFDCEIDYDLIDGACVNLRTMNCINDAPEHATAEVFTEEIGFNELDGWETVSSCGWSCNDGYAEVIGACLLPGQEPLGSACVSGTECESAVCSPGLICAPSELPGGMTYVPEQDQGFTYGPPQDPQILYLEEFYIDVYEVTASAFRQCVAHDACIYDAAGTEENYSTYNTYETGKDNHPINYVNREEAASYCAWKEKRLPAQEEWELAARGTDGRSYPWGNEPSTCDLAVMFIGNHGCGENDTWAVGQKPGGRSPYGAHDLAGNVWEWTNSVYEADPADGVIRGGSFMSTDNFLSSGYRQGASPQTRSGSTGFRCVALVSPREVGEVCIAAADCESRRCAVSGVCAPDDLPDGMTYIPAGDFISGPDSSPTIKNTTAYFLDIYEVTAVEYQECVEEDVCSYEGSITDVARTYDNNRAEYPLNFVSWDEASLYCQWVEKRLPTAQEWEKAARGVDQWHHPWGNEDADCSRAVMLEIANGDSSEYGCETGAPWAVGKKAGGRSPYGAHDMLGNVAEWTSTQSYTMGSSWMTIRGGGYSSTSSYLKVWMEVSHLKSDRESAIGFRCAM